MMMIPYIPCSARIPTFLLFSGIFFPRHSTLVMMLLYLGGILTGIVIALINKKIFFREKSEDYETELPPLRIPNIRAALRGMWSAASEYLKKIGTVVLLAVVIVWALDYFPINEGVPEEEASPSYLHRFGEAVEPVMAPLGFDWKMSAALIAGITAKEFIISTLGVLYQESDEELDTTALSARIASDDNINRANALSFMVFSLLYIPCVATAAVIRRESGSWKWSLISIITTLVVAWLFAFVTFRIGSLLWQ
jgi:ferrous iron transport protein B